MSHDEITTRIVASHGGESSTIEVGELGSSEPVVRFKGVHVYGIKGDAEISVYVTRGLLTGSKVVLHIESKDGKKHRDDCIIVDGSEIVICEEASSFGFSRLKNWRSPDDKKYEPAKKK